MVGSGPATPITRRPARLRDPQLVQLLRPDKQYSAHMQERFQIGPDQIEALYNNAKFQFECGCYSDVVVYVNQYRVLTTNSERTAGALWGMLASEILNQNWDAALEEFNRLKEIIDSKKSSPPLNQLQDRICLMHWSLFIFFHHENGRNGIIDLFFQDRFIYSMACWRWCRLSSPTTPMSSLRLPRSSGSWSP